MISDLYESRHVFGVFQVSEGKREEREERQTRAIGDVLHILCLCVWRSSLALRLLLRLPILTSLL